MAVNAFPKTKRLCGNSLTDLLFSEGDRSIGCFPIRTVWLLRPKTQNDQPSVRILAGASKRHFKHAVDRNRVKRQIREYYRLHCSELEELVDRTGNELLIAFLFTDGKLWPSSELKPRLDSIMEKLKVRVIDNVK